MAPEIALNELAEMSCDKVVLDPMSGSGMVLAQASRLGIPSIGVDLDPLARLISSVGATPISEKSVRKSLHILLDRCRSDIKAGRKVRLPWMDDDEPTSRFIEFWFDHEQSRVLRYLSYHLIVAPVTTVVATRNLLIAAVSRLIITKEPKASLARDTAHSRPHRTIVENDFDVVGALETSVEHILSTLKRSELQIGARTYLGDARKLTRVASGSVDCVLTSPPYLNAIDYMRGHKLSLVWWGHSLGSLSAIRSKAIGSEKASTHGVGKGFDILVQDYDLSELSPRSTSMLKRYYYDLCAQLSETARVLRPNGWATYVIGNSNIRGTYVPNHELLSSAALRSGLRQTNVKVREIPNTRRYLPTPSDGKSALGGRMRSEFILKFERPA
jgi:hypothetical protein